MKKLGLGIFCLFALSFSTALSAETTCKYGEDTVEYTSCLKSEFEKSDLKLKQIYEKLHSASKLYDENDPEADTDMALGGYQKSLEDSQESWAKYRQSECRRYAVYHRFTVSMLMSEYYTCMKSITESRISEFQENLRQ